VYCCGLWGSGGAYERWNAGTVLEVEVGTTGAGSPGSTPSTTTKTIELRLSMNNIEILPYILKGIGN
jgi:hypothetical protein